MAVICSKFQWVKKVWNTFTPLLDFPTAKEDELVKNTGPTRRG